MEETTSGRRACCAGGFEYCDRCDLLVGLEGLRVVSVAQHAGGLVVMVESPPARVGCPACGVVAVSHGRRSVTLIDTPCFDRPVRVVWRKRTRRCADGDCGSGTFSEQDERVAAPRRC